LNPDSKEFVPRHWISADLSISIAPPQSDQADVWRFRFPLPSGAAEIMASVISGEERSRAARFARSSDRIQYTVMHGALRVLLGAITHRQPVPLEFAVNEKGKPYLTNADAGAPHFSLSHSNGVGLLAVSPSAPIGVDVEFERPGFPCVEIAKRFFHAEESARLVALPPDVQPGAFFAAWSRKEAWLKAHGADLGSLGILKVGLGQFFMEGGFWPQNSAPPLGFNNVWLQDLDIMPCYAGALAILAVNQTVPRLRCLDWGLQSQYA
jgi:4'-phosphopantetheinyl transferase